MKQTVIVLEDEADIANLVRHHLQQAGFSVEVDAVPEAAVIVDAEAIHQVFSNLISNALRYGNTLSLTTAARFAWRALWDTAPHSYPA